AEGAAPSPLSGRDAGRLLATAFPDRVARRRPGDAPRYLLSNGRGALLDAHDGLAGEPWLVMAELDGQQREARVFLAAALDQADLEADFAAQIIEQDRLDWDAREGAVMARRE